MGKYQRRRRRGRSWLGPAHPAGCVCAGDHCGQLDAERSARRGSAIRSDDARTRQLAYSLGLSTRRRRPP